MARILKPAVALVLVTMMASATALWVGAAPAKVSAVVKYDALRLKAQGKLLSCLSKSSAAVLLGRGDNSAVCESDFYKKMGVIDKAKVCVFDACRYQDNNDGTVSDLKTGLTWEKKITNPGSVHSVDNTYTWSESGSFPDGTIFSSFQFALNGFSSDGVTTEQCFANHCDWRLPTVEELSGIVWAQRPACGPSLACINSDLGPTSPGSYWSASTYLIDFRNAWTVSFGGGLVVAVAKTGSTYVRAVRDGVSVPLTPVPTPTPHP
jgi:hypothetical protein